MQGSRRRRGKAKLHTVVAISLLDSCIYIYIYIYMYIHTYIHALCCRVCRSDVYTRMKFLFGIKLLLFSDRVSLSA